MTTRSIATGHLVGYARVSTGAQDASLQIDELERAGCVRVYTDHGVSGAKTSRPELDRCLDRLEQGDTLVVWKLDRLGRSLSHLIITVEDLAARGVGFRSLTEGIDTSTAAGRLTLGIFSTLSSFERDLIRERTTAGLAAARSRGRVGGRPPVIDQRKGRSIRTLYTGGGYTVSEIALEVGVSRASVYNYLKAQGLSGAATLA
ncbi:recombinase family protein [Arthrobacter crystallopoietes]|uniref:Site-specific DNA recombinase n=1 Tax=Crystallibacter crystallopoietes TaxID=37928 RepID=A0A1H1BDU8_9MICC|nr:recombinase family protein [Arthrobacter crystallopoietes]AUI51175.1 hypothetical protein AC20117_10545 [Arthrobacter crystallopoietes]SDQ50164.1 Site-specific DNA recombinase [Arthrobacter crystallopoietes]